MSTIIRADVADLPVLSTGNCACYRAFGRVSCARGHGYCPFLVQEAKEQGTTWRRLVAKQAKAFREAGLKWVPLVGWSRRSTPESSERPFDPWCPYCGADAYVSGCVEGHCRGLYP